MTPIHEGAPVSIERAVTLSDGVVAIAMTLLVLPLVDIVPDADLDRVSSLFDEHTSLFVSFVVSFLVIYLFWVAQQRVFAAVDGPAPGLRALNALWLLGIIFLPFPTALIGRQPTTSSTPVYIGTMLILSMLTLAMTYVAARATPDPATVDHMRRLAVLWWIFSGVFLICTLVSLANADAGLYGLLSLVVVRGIGLRWTRAKRD